jgi:hypothetical protein
MSDDIVGLIAGFMGGGAAIAIFLAWQTRKAVRETFGPSYLNALIWPSHWLTPRQHIYGAVSRE